MSGLNTKVSKKIPPEDGYMGCRDVYLNFTSSNVDDFICTMGILMEMQVMMCMLNRIFYHFMKHEAMYANREPVKVPKYPCK